MQKNSLDEWNWLPGNLSLFECSVGLDQLNSEIKTKKTKNLHWKCKCSWGKRRMGNSWKKSWLGTLQETTEVSGVTTAQALDAPQHLPLGCTHWGMEELLPPPCSGDKIPGKSVHGSLCSLEFPFWDEIWPTHTQCSRFLQNPTGLPETRTSFHTLYSHSFYLQPNFYPFISKGEHSFAWAFLFFPQWGLPLPEIPKIADTVCSSRNPEPFPLSYKLPRRLYYNKRSFYILL